MKLWQVEHFFFQISADLEKKWGKNVQTGQSFIFSEWLFSKSIFLMTSHVFLAILDPATYANIGRHSWTFP